MHGQERIERLFSKLKEENRAGFAAFITACDPNFAMSSDIMRALPEAGVDMIELGMPFSDPMADGAAIQASSQRALSGGGNMKNTFALLRDFRKNNIHVPVILMGYYNPVLAYGLELFARDAVQAGADGVIIVDLPLEEDEDFRRYAHLSGLCVIQLVAPTSKADRLSALLKAADSFLYYVSITGTTGAARPDFDLVDKALQEIRRQTSKPIALGFGIKTPEDARHAAKIADIVVVGSALVEKIGRAAQDNMAETLRDYAADLASAIRSVSRE